MSYIKKIAIVGITQFGESVGYFYTSDDINT